MRNGSEIRALMQEALSVPLLHETKPIVSRQTNNSAGSAEAPRSSSSRCQATQSTVQELDIHHPDKQLSDTFAIRTLTTDQNSTVVQPAVPFKSKHWSAADAKASRDAATKARGEALMVEAINALHETAGLWKLPQQQCSPKSDSAFHLQQRQASLDDFLKAGQKQQRTKSPTKGKALCCTNPPACHISQPCPSNVPHVHNEPDVKLLQLQLDSTLKPSRDFGCEAGTRIVQTLVHKSLDDGYNLSGFASMDNDHVEILTVEEPNVNPTLGKGDSVHNKHDTGRAAFCKNLEQKAGTCSDDEVVIIDDSSSERSEHVCKQAPNVNELDEDLEGGFPTIEAPCGCWIGWEQAKARVMGIYKDVIEVVDFLDLDQLMNVGSICEQHPGSNVLMEEGQRLQWVLKQLLPAEYYNTFQQHYQRLQAEEQFQQLPSPTLLDTPAVQLASRQRKRKRNAKTADAKEQFLRNCAKRDLRKVGRAIQSTGPQANYSGLLPGWHVPAKPPDHVDYTQHVWWQHVVVVDTSFLVKPNEQLQLIELAKRLSSYKRCPATIFCPLVVVHELDNLKDKHRLAERGLCARKAIHMLQQLTELNGGLQGGKVVWMETYVESEKACTCVVMPRVLMNNDGELKGDAKIMRSALYLKQQLKGDGCIFLLTHDNGLRLQAQTNGILNLTVDALPYIWKEI